MPDTEILTKNCEDVPKYYLNVQNVTFVAILRYIPKYYPSIRTKMNLWRIFPYFSSAVYLSALFSWVLLLDLQNMSL